jgi:hypothetical protein
MLNPTWRLEPRINGPTLIVGGFVYHPGEDPVRIGRMQAMEATIKLERTGAKHALLIGFGLGYLAAPLSALLDIPLTIWDCLPVAREERKDRWVEALKNASVVRTEEEVDEVLGEQTVVLTHNTAVDLHYWQVHYCESRFARMQKRSMKSITQRSIDFLMALPELGLVEEHYGIAPGKTAVLVSKGPSLDLELVKELWKKGYPIICAAQAYQQLAATRIVPDITVCLDPQPTIFEQLHGAKPKWIYAEAMSDPRIWQEWKNHCFCYLVPASHCHSMVWKQLGYSWMDDPCITVSEQMLEIASRLGFTQVITSGIDYYSPIRTDVMKIECEENRWSWIHYFGGSQAWDYMLRIYGIRWIQGHHVDMENLPDQPPILFPAPSTQIGRGFIERHLREFAEKQDVDVQASLMSRLPESVRESFKPLTQVGVLVNK